MCICTCAYIVCVYALQDTGINYISACLHNKHCMYGQTTPCKGVHTFTDGLEIPLFWNCLDRL